MNTSERVRRDASERSPTDSHELNLTAHIRNAFSSELPGCGAVPPPGWSRTKAAVPCRPPSTVHRPPSTVYRPSSPSHLVSSRLVSSRLVSSRVSSRLVSRVSCLVSCLVSSRLVQSRSVSFHPVPSRAVPVQLINHAKLSHERKSPVRPRATGHEEGTVETGDGIPAARSHSVGHSDAVTDSPTAGLTAWWALCRFEDL